MKILLNEWGNIDHPDILEVVNKLSRITGFSLPSVINSEIYKQEVTLHEDEMALTSGPRTLKAPPDAIIKYQLQDYTEEEDTFTEQAYSFKRQKKLPGITGFFRRKIEMLPVPYSWQSVFKIL